MLDGGSGGYSGTNWFGHDVVSMWQQVSSGATDAHYEVSLGWKRTAELTSTHLSRVTEYRNNLAAAWPPKQGSASEAYVAQLNMLITSLTETEKAASANYAAFSSVVSSLADARRTIEPLYTEYVANQQSISHWQAAKDAALVPLTPTASSSSTPTPSPSPQASPVPSSPPVSSARQEQLNNLARSAMYDLSSAVISGQAALQKPQPYAPKVIDLDGGGNSNEDNSPGTLVPPVIPAPIPMDTGSPKQHRPGDTAPVFAPRVPNGSGPILTGTLPTPPAVSSPVIGGLPTAPTTPGGMPGVIGTPGILTPVGGGFLPRSTLPYGGLIKPDTSLGTQPMTAMPSGNVIGARPGTGMIGQMPVGGRAGGMSPSRVNPVGGVIGSQPGAGGPMVVGSRGGSRMSGANGQPSSVMGQQGRGRRRGENEDPQRWDPDNPWLTAEGVDPIVLPPNEPGPIDPGPAIGRSW
ncbi:MAG: hypothetical protein QOE51_1447 [Actinoplanes sp.]|jgi:hypothetical protein|nr:hypothetical protein [Actinoplanes sp.]